MEGHYALGSSPLALLWKDPKCSRYFIDTDSEGKQLSEQVQTITHPYALPLDAGVLLLYIMKGTQDPEFIFYWTM